MNQSLPRLTAVCVGALTMPCFAQHAGAEFTGGFAYGHGCGAAAAGECLYQGRRAARPQALAAVRVGAGSLFVRPELRVIGDAQLNMVSPVGAAIGLMLRSTSAPLRPYVLGSDAGALTITEGDGGWLLGAAVGLKVGHVPGLFTELPF